uniref:Uncharacterized protein n=1 Tax=Opuntia streptacantha TaxID=393608 RepID=A0A7C9DH77_OPUST
MTPSPGFIKPNRVAAVASVQPEVTVTSLSGSTESPVSFLNLSATAELRSGTPQPRAYWFFPSVMAWIAAAFTKSGPSEFGFPGARLIAPCLIASRFIWVKMLVLNFSKRFATCKRAWVSEIDKDIIFYKMDHLRLLLLTWLKE